MKAIFEALEKGNEKKAEARPKMEIVESVEFSISTENLG